MPEDPITIPSQPVNRKGPQPIEVTGFGWGESAVVEGSGTEETKESAEPPAKE